MPSRDDILADCSLKAAGVTAVAIERDLAVRPVDVVTVAKPVGSINPRSVTQAFARRVETIGFGRIRFHDLRGIHSTALLDAGIPVHTVAQRIGDDPAVQLRSYAKRRRSKRADEMLLETIAGLTAGFLKT